MVGLPLKEPAQREVYEIVASRSHMSDETKGFIDALETTKEKQLVSIAYFR